MKKMILIIGLIISPLPLIAAPPEVITKLMNKEVSLFSFGMYRLNRSLENFTPDGWHSEASFDWDRGAINIYSVAFIDNCIDYHECTTKIKDQILKFDKYFCYRLPENKTSRCDRDRLAEFFTPIGYSISNFHNGQSSRDAARDLSRRVEYEFGISATAAGKGYSCTQKYSSRDVYCRER